MSWFVAIPVAPLAPAAAAAWARLRAEAPQARWTAPAGWHVTLQFLGELDAGQAEAASRALSRLSAARFEFVLAGLGVFPAPRRPRILWAGVHAPGAAWPQLAAAVGELLAGAGFAAEPRPYHPHLTLARARHPVDLRAMTQCLDDFHPEWGRQTADAVCLYRSRRHTGSDANPYEIVASVALV